MVVVCCVFVISVVRDSSVITLCVSGFCSRCAVAFVVMRNEGFEELVLHLVLRHGFFSNCISCLDSALERLHFFLGVFAVVAAVTQVDWVTFVTTNLKIRSSSQQWKQDYLCSKLVNRWLQFFSVLIRSCLLDSALCVTMMNLGICCNKETRSRPNLVNR